LETRTREFTSRLVVVALLLLLSASPVAAASHDTAPALLGPSTGPERRGTGPRGGTPAVARWRYATVQAEVLTGADGSPKVTIGDRVGLRLFDDASFTATISEFHRHGAGGYAWAGTLDGVDLGSVVLAMHDDAVVGTVIMPGTVYRIGYAPDGSQVIEQVDTSALPTEAEPLTPPPLADDRVTRSTLAGDGASQIDVMVVYTAAARIAAGGTAPMQAEVTAAVASANQAYTNNGLVQRLRLVYAGEVSIRETNNFSADIETLRANPTVASLRDTNAADLVSLLVYNGAAAFCGIGYLMTQNSTSFAPYGYSLVERTCATAGLTFAHELGHNMGAHHDPYVNPEPGLDPYSHGYVDLIGQFRTIMSYNNQCAAQGVGCTRLPFFSTPNLTFNARPIGNASTSDNGRTLGESANAVANFRQSVAPPAPPPTSVTPPKVFRDLNGDGKADILWRNTSGTVGMWFLNGTSLTGSGVAATVPTQWRIVGDGDFNGDGKLDILWQDTSGSVAVWLLNGASVIGTGFLGILDSNWTVAGVADFNGDGKADILWRHSSGTLAVWLMNGLTVIGSGMVGSLASDATILGVGDFNGDGKADILLRNSAGAITIWLLNGASIVGTGSVGVLGSDWTVSAVADFNGDGRADIAWRHTSGNVVVWLINSFSIIGSASLGTISTDWTILGAGDFNGDARADLLWRNSSGGVAVWLLNGLSVIGTGSPGGAPADWQIQ
jgi:Metallo-peptidase family M12B Reprolysin-like/FG-GAP-like repeat